MTLTQTSQLLVEGDRLRIGSIGDRAITPHGTEVMLRNDVLRFHTLLRIPAIKTGGLPRISGIAHVSRPYNIIAMDLQNGMWDGRLQDPYNFDLEEVFYEGDEGYKKFDWFLTNYGVK